MAFRSSFAETLEVVQGVGAEERSRVVDTGLVVDTEDEVVVEGLSSMRSVRVGEKLESDRGMSWGYKGRRMAKDFELVHVGEAIASTGDNSGRKSW